MIICRKCNANPMGPDAGPLEGWGFDEEVCGKCLDRARLGDLMAVSDAVEEDFDGTLAYDRDWRQP